MRPPPKSVGETAARFATLRAVLFPRWRSGTAWRVRSGYRTRVPSHNVLGYCDDARRVIWISPGLTGNDLDASIVHEIVHAVAGPGHTRRFIARLRQAADVALDHGLGPLAVALRTEADAIESTPKMRASDVYLEIEDAAWQGAPLAAVAAGIGLTQAELLRRYPRAAGVHAAALTR